MRAHMVVFATAKLGNEEREWEDGAAGWCGDPVAGHNPRFAVADGATGAFGAARWAEQLVSGFVGTDGAGFFPRMRPDSIGHWLAAMQDCWQRQQQTAGGNELARLKAAQVGSFATLLGCELSGLDGPQPRWDAVALGDAVLYHVRDDQAVQFPRIAAEEFGSNPDGASTKPEALEGMVSRLAFGHGELAVGDRLYLTTDAVAQWVARTGPRAGRSLWSVLAGLDHPDTFRRLVTDRRRAGEMANDDVTLLRVDLVASEPAYLVVCP